MEEARRTPCSRFGLDPGACSAYASLSINSHCYVAGCRYVRRASEDSDESPATKLLGDALSVLVGDRPVPVLSPTASAGGALPRLSRAEKRGIALALCGSRVPEEWLKNIKPPRTSLRWVRHGFETGTSEDPWVISAARFIASKDIHSTWQALFHEMDGHLSSLRRGNSAIVAAYLGPEWDRTVDRPEQGHWADNDPSAWREQK